MQIDLYFSILTTVLSSGAFVGLELLAKHYWFSKLISPSIERQRKLPNLKKANRTLKAILLSNFSYGVMAATSAIAIDFSIIAISPSIPVTPIVSLEFLTHLHNTWLIRLAVLICHFVGFYFVLHFKTRAEVNFLSMLTLQPEKNGMKAKSSITISDILGGLLLSSSSLLLFARFNP